MRIIIYIFIVSLFFALLLPVQGQNPMGLYFMETIPQSSQINPAIQPRANGFFALPSANLLFQSDVAFRDVFQEQGNEWITPLNQNFNYSDLYNVIGKAANINQYAGVDILGLGFRTGRDYFSFTMSLKNVMQIGMPSDLFKISDLGFPDGESFDFSAMRVKEVAYHELAVGYSRKWNDKFTFGIKVKPLFGIAGGMTDINSFKLKTTATQWDMYVDGTIYTSGPIKVEEGTPGDFPESIDVKNLDGDEEQEYLTSFKNAGMAFDFGAVYQHNDKWIFSAALTNLGYVKFKEELNSLSFNGTYSFKGIDVDGTDDDAIKQAFEDIGDSIKTIINYDVGHEKFNIPLTPLWYMGASYQWMPSVSIGLLSRSVFQKQNFRQDFCLSANIQPYSFVSLNLNYSKRIKGGNGLGTALSVLAGPLQMYLAADYIPIRYADVAFDDGDSFPMVHRQKDLSFRFGFNLIFGRHGSRKKEVVLSEDLTQE
jgi:hypothetical protein